VNVRNVVDGEVLLVRCLVRLHQVWDAVAGWGNCRRVWTLTLLDESKFAEFLLDGLVVGFEGLVVRLQWLFVCFKGFVLSLKCLIWSLKSLTIGFKCLIRGFKSFAVGLKCFDFSIKSFVECLQRLGVVFEVLMFFGKSLKLFTGLNKVGKLTGKWLVFVGVFLQLFLCGLVSFL
jgi:hypothetical protein